MNRIFATFKNTDTYPLTLDRTATYIIIRNSDAILPLEVKLNTDYGRVIEIV